MINKKSLLIIWLLILSFFSCVKEKVSKEKVIFTTILPVKYLVNKITNGEFMVYSLVGKNMDPHSFTITPDQMTKLSKAMLIFTIGLESEKIIISKIKEMSPNIKIVNLKEELGLKEEAHFHRGNENQEEIFKKEKEPLSLHCESKDPHIWTSPRLLKEICFTISKHIIGLEPTKRDSIFIYQNSLISQIDSIDLFLRENLAPYKNRKFFVFHPSFGYLADNYGLVQISIEVDGKEPSINEIKNIVEIAKREKPYFIFVQPQFSKKSASVIAKEIGCEIFHVDPLAEDILSEIYNFGVALKRNFENVK